MVLGHSWAVAKDRSPARANQCFGQRWWAAPIPVPTPSNRHGNMAAQPPRNVTIHRRKRVRLAVLEIAIPPAQRPVHIGHDCAPAPPVQSRGVRAHPFLQLCQALLSRPSPAALEGIPKEVKAAGRTRVHHAGLVGMQGQPRPVHPRTDFRHRLAGRGFRPAQDHAVVRVAHHRPARRPRKFEISDLKSQRTPPPGRRPRAPSPERAGVRAGSWRSRFSDRRPPPRRGPPCAAWPPAAARPWPRAPVGSRRCARQTPPRRPVPERAATRLAQCDHAPPVGPAGALLRLAASRPPRTPVWRRRSASSRSHFPASPGATVVTRFVATADARTPAGRRFGSSLAAGTPLVPGGSP